MIKSPMINKFKAPLFKLKRSPLEVNPSKDLLTQIQKLKSSVLDQKNSILQLKDGMTPECLKTLLDAHIAYVKIINEVDQKIKKNQIKIDIDRQIKTRTKKQYIRAPNFPSEISENIVKYIILKVYGVIPNWNVGGDLIIEELGLKLEVKAFSSQLPSPTSYGPGIENSCNGSKGAGPKEAWNRLYHLDATKFREGLFTLYDIPLSNTDPIFTSLMMNRTTTFADQCANGRRPRIMFHQLKEQLPDDMCQKIFSGHLDDILN